MKESVGIVIVSKKTNKFLLLHRTKEPIVWSTLSGKMETGEKPLTTIKREIGEEININPDKVKDIKKLGVVTSGNKKHHVFIGYVEDELELNLKKDENDDYGWFTLKTLPSPIHKKWSDTLTLVKPHLSVVETLIKKVLNRLLF